VAAAELCHRGGSPARAGRDGRGRELHWHKGKLIGGLVWAMRERRGGATVRPSSQELGKGAADSGAGMARRGLL